MIIKISHLSKKVKRPQGVTLTCCIQQDLSHKKNLSQNDTPFIWPRYACGFGSSSNLLQVFYDFSFASS